MSTEEQRDRYWQRQDLQINGASVQELHDFDRETIVIYAEEVAGYFPTSAQQLVDQITDDDHYTINGLAVESQGELAVNGVLSYCCPVGALGQVTKSASDLKHWPQYAPDEKEVIPFIEDDFNPIFDALAEENGHVEGAEKYAALVQLAQSYDTYRNDHAHYLEGLDSNILMGKRTEIKKDASRAAIEGMKQGLTKEV